MLNIFRVIPKSGTDEKQLSSLSFSATGALLGNNSDTSKLQSSVLQAAIFFVGTPIHILHAQPFSSKISHSTICSVPW